MFCPVCKYEFRRGFTHCNTCDVELVDALPPEEEVDHAPPPTAAQMDHPTLLWSGASGGIFSALTAALDEVQVPYNKEELDARLVFSSQHADLEVWVPVANLPQAQPILDSILANPLHANDAASGVLDIENEDGTSAELPAALRDEVGDEDDEGVAGVRHEYVARELYPEDATAEVWSGHDEMLAEVLKTCLAEIGINCYVRTPESEEDDASSDARTNKPAAPFAVRVLPEDETRAKQIVREVTDAAPPE
ncbi:MAG: hypothetical protein WBE86_01895 [Candidatus Acidiferrales bacterium]